MINKKRKHPVSISLSNAEWEIADKIGKGKNFSQKLSWIIEDLQKRSNLLVIYNTDIEWENGRPELINKNAARLYSYSHYAEGIGSADYEGEDEFDRAFEIAEEVLGKNKRMPTDELVPLLHEAGYIVQVIENTDFGVYDIWVALKSSEDSCKQCPKFNQFVSKVEKAVNDAKGVYNEA